MDTILYNGKIYTMCGEGCTAEAVAIKGNTIYKVGNSKDVLQLAASNTRLVDLAGRCAIPGFNDSHLHLISTAINLGTLDLMEAKSKADVIYMAKQFIAANSLAEGQWLIGHSWNQDFFTDDSRFLTKEDLNAISTTHPIALARVCGHVATINSCAIEKIGITKQTHVAGGQLDLDASGNLTGVLRENALNLLDKYTGVSSKEAARSLIKKAIAYANSKGITSVQSDDLGVTSALGDFEETFRLFQELEESNELSLRIYEQCLLGNINNLSCFISKGYYTGKGSSLFKIGPLKILLDGSLGARTAKLSYDYEDAKGERGILLHTKDELDELILAAHSNNISVAVHGIGDQAMYYIFDSIRKAQQAHPRPDARHAIVHCQITDERLIEMFIDQGVVALVQPEFLHYDLHIVESRIGKERAKHTYAFKTMVDKGIRVGFGTDSPIDKIDPLYCIYCAVTRKDFNGKPEEGWLPEQKMSVYDSVYAYTAGSAYASFEEGIKGQVKEGMLADMVVLSHDIFSIPPSTIKDVEVCLTMVDGKVAYQR